MIRGAIWFCILASVPSTARGGLTREQAVAEALRHNPSLIAAAEQVAQARARVFEAAALPDPTFEATLEQEKSFWRPRSATSKDLGLGLTLPFPDKIRLGARIARTDVDAARQVFDGLRQQIAAQTAHAYDALLVAIRNREILTDAKTLAEDFLKKTQSRFDAGTAPKLDVVKARVDLAQAQTDLIANERDVANAQNTVNRLMGRDLQSPVEPGDALEVPPALPKPDALEALARSSRPELLALRAQQSGARDATRLAREYLFPDFSLTLSRNFTQGDPSAYSTAASVTLPLLFWQHEKGQVAEARHREEELKATESDLRLQIGLEVRTAYAAADVALREAAFLRDELVPEARQAYRIASASYGLGGSSSLEVLDAERTLLGAENQAAASLGAALDARVDLELAVGAPLPAQATGEHHDESK